MREVTTPDAEIRCLGIDLSIFASQDPVAIDSVAYDFLYAEWPDVVEGGTGDPGSLEGGAQDYLHM